MAASRNAKISMAQPGLRLYLQDMTFERETVRAGAAELAAQGVFLGTSSWKYEGWLGQLYCPDRYMYRGKMAKSRFDRNCLAEYAEVFKTVCVDAAYYDFPRREQLETLAGAVPPDFRFGFKVTDAVTVKRFPNLPRFGARAGQINPGYLDPELFTREFLGPCEAIREKVGILMFEFSRFRPEDYEHGRDFLADLDRFLTGLPQGWPCAVEIRNDKWLRPEYFDCLRRHGVAHVFNSWQAMPSVAAQMAIPESRPRSDLMAARFLLKPGRKYAEAVASFQPYDRTREVNEEARQAAALLAREGLLYLPRKKVYIYVNNRLEGNAPLTLQAILAIVKVSAATPNQPRKVE